MASNTPSSTLIPPPGLPSSSSSFGNSNGTKSFDSNGTNTDVSNNYNNILDTKDILFGSNGGSNPTGSIMDHTTNTTTNNNRSSLRPPTFLGSIDDSSFSNSQTTVVSTSAYSVDSSISTSTGTFSASSPRSNGFLGSNGTSPLSYLSNSMNSGNHNNDGNSVSLNDPLPGHNNNFGHPMVNNPQSSVLPFIPPLPNNNGSNNSSYGNNKSNSSSSMPPLPSNPPYPTTGSASFQGITNSNNNITFNQQGMYGNNISNYQMNNGGLMDTLTKSMNQLDLTPNTNNNTGNHNTHPHNYGNKVQSQRSFMDNTSNNNNMMMNSIVGSNFPYSNNGNGNTLNHMLPNKNNHHPFMNNHNNSVPSLPNNNYFANNNQHRHSSQGMMIKQPITNPITLHHQNNYYANNNLGHGNNASVPVPGPDPLAYLRLNLRVDCTAIAEGKEQRTTIMIRNIPSRYTQQLLIDELVASGFRGCFDFIYLPIDFRNGCSMGYSFANFIHPQDVVHFFTRWNGRRWPQFSSRKRCELAFARIQGKQALIEHFQHSRTLLASPANCRPIVFTSSGPRRGEVEPFPFRFIPGDATVMNNGTNSMNMTDNLSDPLLDFSNDIGYAGGNGNKDTSTGSVAIGNFPFMNDNSKFISGGNNGGFGNSNNGSVLPNTVINSKISQNWNIPRNTSSSLTNDVSSNSFPSAITGTGASSSYSNIPLPNMYSSNNSSLFMNGNGTNSTNLSGINEWNTSIGSSQTNVSMNNQIITNSSTSNGSSDIFSLGNLTNSSSTMNNPVWSTSA